MIIKYALAAIKERSRLLEFKARLLGEISSTERSPTTVNQIGNINIKALLLDPKSRQAIEVLASKAGGQNGS